MDFSTLHPDYILTICRNATNEQLSELAASNKRILSICSNELANRRQRLDARILNNITNLHLGGYLSQLYAQGYNIVNEYNRIKRLYNLDNYRQEDETYVKVELPVGSKDAIITGLASTLIGQRYKRVPRMELSYEDGILDLIVDETRSVTLNDHDLYVVLAILLKQYPNMRLLDNMGESI